MDLQEYYNANALIMAFILCVGGLTLSGVYYAIKALDSRFSWGFSEWLSKAGDKAINRLYKNA
jgi:ABC-type transport system involved in cytochrome c biogenesis permease subunit